ncbi:DUF2062 domain-containing protein [Alkalilimnicola sp. S0819]|uniref:DUF2062 domain-containing protein n=1 Tax=Alkalilimnicola sp. S0819 TaxID=2613922 RepID=UPI001261FE56|nr:DUF2062 domain-containing protein [Alkalilimnicola sp. S0819]KAB7627632.1 DUF2062 domain-containing protein [Alkalilimnicola sp. S0819]MPQ15797.1 DUF2062 domain-containing protein [Alkalilimnicola sp. S0819]
MPKKFLKRHLPDPVRFRQRRGVRLFGRLLDDPFLLHLNRRSVAGGVGLGLFVAFIPLPAQMLLAAAAAILFRANILIAVSAVWITNPLTIPPFFWLCYRVGVRVLGEHEQRIAFEPSLGWLWTEATHIWQPLLTGSLLVGSIIGLAGYGAAHLLWRLHVMRLLHQRRQRGGR